MTRVSVFGAGAWGTALAVVLAEGGSETTLWSWQEEHAAAMRRTRENHEFFPGVALPDSLRITSDRKEAASEAEVVVFVVPSHALRDTVVSLRPFLKKDVVLVSATKGIETESLCLMSDVIDEGLETGATSSPEATGKLSRVVVLSGPSFAREVAQKAPTNLVAASYDAELAHRVQDLFYRDWLRVYTSSDPVGVELGGALKNVIAIAAGALDGLGLGQNTQAALITRGIAEMTRLSVACGGQERTMAGLAGVGDLVLTCTGALSRNRTLGQKLGQGVPLAEALAQSQGIAEGYRTAQSVHDLAKQLQVDLPICGAVYSVLFEGRSPQEALNTLLSRPRHAEWE